MLAVAVAVGVAPLAVGFSTRLLTWRAMSSSRMVAVQVQAAVPAVLLLQVHLPVLTAA